MLHLPYCWLAAWRGIQSSGCPLVSPYPPQSSRLPSVIMSAEVSPHPGIHFLSLDGLEVFRNIDQMSSSCRVCSIFLIIAWDHRFGEKITEEKYHFHSVWRGVLQACAMLCGLGTPVGVLHYECVPSPVLWQASRGERRQEGQAQENCLGQTSIRIHPCSSVWNLPPSQFTFGAQADRAC